MQGFTLLPGILDRSLHKGKAQNVQDSTPPEIFSSCDPQGRPDQTRLCIGEKVGKMQDFTPPGEKKQRSIH